MELYSEALGVCPDAAVIRSNRAAAHLALDQPQQALDDCDFICQRCPAAVNAKVLLRMGLALRALCRFPVLRLIRWRA